MRELGVAIPLNLEDVHGCSSRMISQGEDVQWGGRRGSHSSGSGCIRGLVLFEGRSQKGCKCGWARLRGARAMSSRAVQLDPPLSPRRPHRPRRTLSNLACLCVTEWCLFPGIIRSLQRLPAQATVGRVSEADRQGLFRIVQGQAAFRVPIRPHPTQCTNAKHTTAT